MSGFNLKTKIQRMNTIEEEQSTHMMAVFKSLHRCRADQLSIGKHKRHTVIHENG